MWFDEKWFEVTWTVCEFEKTNVTLACLEGYAIKVPD